MTKGNTTYHLCRMEKRELVDWRTEGRKNRLYLPPGEGRPLPEKAFSEHLALIEERLSGLSVRNVRTSLI